MAKKRTKYLKDVFHKTNFEYNKPEENIKQPISDKTPKEIFKEVKSIVKDNEKFLEEIQKVSGTKIHL